MVFGLAISGNILFINYQLCRINAGSMSGLLLYAITTIILSLMVVLGLIDIE